MRRDDVRQRPVPRGPIAALLERVRDGRDALGPGTLEPVGIGLVGHDRHDLGAHLPGVDRVEQRLAEGS